MRILMISDVYFPRINGVSTSIQTFRRTLAARGHDVQLIAPDYGAGDPSPPWLHRIPARRVPFDPEDRIMNRRRAIQRGLKLAEGADVVHIHTPFVAHAAGLQIARRRALPVIESYHTYFEEYLHHYVPLLPRGLTRLLARRISKSQCAAVDAVIVPSSAMRDALTAYGVEGPMHIVPTGIDHRRFRGGDGERFRRRHGIDPARPMFVHVGRVAFEKNIDFLIDVIAAASRERPDILLIIAGEGPASAELRRRVKRAGIESSVLFVGYLDRERELLDCYRAGHGFLFASRTETQGLVLLESMALGVPVISTAVMGTRDILAAGKGALVCGEDVAEFKHAILRLISDGGLRERLGAEALSVAESWSTEAMTSRLLELYTGLEAAARGRSNPQGVSASAVNR